MLALQENADTAVLFLDVVMENAHSGLGMCADVSKTQAQQHVNAHHPQNRSTRRSAREDQIIREYDINDYRLKTDMTVSRLNTSLYTALRNYRDLNRIEKNKLGLEKIVRASSKLFRHNSMNDFFHDITTAQHLL